MSPLVVERDRPERGSVAVLTCGLIAVALVLAIAVVSVGGAVVLAGRAEAAADSAALAAADTMALGPASEACAAAGRVAVTNSARLVECEPDTTGVEVVVELRGGNSTVLGRVVRARSRAELDFSELRAGAAR